MNTLKYITNKYNLDIKDKRLIEIPNVGRDNLASLLYELDFKNGIEVGVASGEYLSVLCGRNPQMQFSGVDVWLPYEGYTDYMKQSTFDTLKETAVKRLIPFSNYNFIEKFSIDAVKDFEDNSLDFVYIDSNHSDPYVTEDITEWSKKIRSGGIVAGHDYVQAKNIDVVDAITKYTKKNNIKPLFVLGAYHKASGEIRDNTRSWMFVKQ